MSPKAKRRLRIAAVLLCGVVVAVPIAWRAAPRLLVVDTGLPAAAEMRINAIVVLGGEPWTRPQRAAEVYREVTGDREPGVKAVHGVWVLVSGNGDCEDVRRQLEVRAVPASAIETECKSTSTFENAAFSVPLLREQGATNVVIVTSWFHSRRALACFQAAAPDIHFYSEPTPRPSEQGRWFNKYERDRILREYAKILYYWLVHGVSPFA